MNSKITKKFKFKPLKAVIKNKLKNNTFKRAYIEEINIIKLAEEIRALRQEKNMTQANIAAKTNMPQSVIARLESGTHSFSIATLQKVASALGATISLVATQNRR